MARNAFYAQSGGVTAVLNASAAGVIETARAHPQIGKLYAGRNGILGALDEDLLDTTVESAADIRALCHTPAAAFGSCRYKLSSLEQNRAEYTRLMQVFAAHDIGYFFYNGGGDSADTCLKVSQLAHHLDYPLQALHIPKTVDNDLAVTDNCPGFGSAAKYIAVSVREASFDVAAMAKTSTKAFVFEVMGRHAGWLAAAGGMAADAANDLPLLLLLPEVRFDRARFLAEAKRLVEHYGYVCVVVSEGVRNAEGEFLSAQGLVDAFGHAQLGGVAAVVANMIKQELGYKYHWSVADYLQRAARHIAAKTDVEQAYAVGKAAVEFALRGETAIMPTIVRIADQPYRWEIGRAQLGDVANIEKMLPEHFIREDGFGITPACRRYLAPLLSGEDYPPYRDGLPYYVRLKNVAVQKKLQPR